VFVRVPFIFGISFRPGCNGTGLVVMGSS